MTRECKQSLATRDDVIGNLKGLRDDNGRQNHESGVTEPLWLLIIPNNTF